MNNQPTTPEGTNAHAATTASIFKELVLEFIDPVKNYGYLYILTIVSLVTNARVVVASIINPPTEEAHNREDLRAQWSKAKSWLKSSGAHKSHSVEQAFTAKPGRKYYNPISFLALTIGLKILISSTFSLKEPPVYERYCNEVSAPVEEKLVEQLKEGTITKDEFTRSQKELAEADIKQALTIKRVEQLVAIDYFKKVLPLFVIVAVCLLHSFFMHKISKKFATIELFITGVYINTLLLIVMYWLNSVISFMGKDLWFLSDVTYFMFLCFYPSVLYFIYMQTSGNNSSTWKNMLSLPIYYSCFTVMNFAFRWLVDFITYLSIGT